MWRTEIEPGFEILTRRDEQRVQQLAAAELAREDRHPLRHTRPRQHRRVEGGREGVGAEAPRAFRGATGQGRSGSSPDASGRGGSSEAASFSRSFASSCAAIEGLVEEGKEVMDELAKQIKAARGNRREVMKRILQTIDRAVPFQCSISVWEVAVASW